MTPGQLPAVSNRYYAMRHGQSEANRRNIIISNPIEGVNGFGLTEEGIRQAEQGALLLKSLSKDLIIYSSDFLRARQTAERVSAVLKLNEVVKYSPLLRERFFGTFDKQSCDNYPLVWAHDESSKGDIGRWGEEPVASVAGRVTRFIEEVDNHHKGRNIVIVAHGDILQIMQTVFQGIDPRLHRRVEHLGVAEVRPLG